MLTFLGILCNQLKQNVSLQIDLLHTYYIVYTTIICNRLQQNRPFFIYSPPSPHAHSVVYICTTSLSSAIQIYFLRCSENHSSRCTRAILMWFYGIQNTTLIIFLLFIVFSFIIQECIIDECILRLWQMCLYNLLTGQSRIDNQDHRHSWHGITTPLF